jgi:DNA polymerase
MSILYLDIETYSDQKLAVGTPAYAEHPSTEVLLVAYAVGDAPARVWERAITDMPDELRRALDSDCTVVIHNSFFDRSVLREVEGIVIPPARIEDTMVQALSHGLPGGLDELGTLFGLKNQKMKDGKRLVQLFCSPLRGKRTVADDKPEQWATFVEYARMDVETMRELHGLLPKWNYKRGSKEHTLWCIDQRINDRGFAVDTVLAEQAVEQAEAEKHLLRDEMSEATDGVVGAATQRDALLQHLLAAHGVSLPDLRKDTVQRRLDDPDLPEPVRELLENRASASRSSSSKYTAVLKAVNQDNRLRGTLQFCGASGTGRWAGRVFQPQNMMRPTMGAEQVAQAVDDVRQGVAGLLYTNLAEVLGNVVRGLVVAPEGKKLVCADLRSIEGRSLAWLAGEQPVLSFYKAFDEKKVDYDSYQLTYSLVFGGDPSAVTKDLRQIGKVLELSMGYGGGVAAFLTFAATYHLDLPALSDTIWGLGDASVLRECSDKHEWAKEHGYDAGLPKAQYAAFEYAKQKWREGRPETVKLWRDLSDAYRNAVEFDKQAFGVGDRPIALRRDGQWMRMRLPSGRNVVFLRPKVEEGQLSYAGKDHYTRKWTRLMLHGGKLSGILTQAFARDVLAYQLPAIESAGYEVVLSVHDEIIAQVEDSDSFTAEGLETLMTAPLAWARGLPLAAEGFEAKRYRK